MIVVGVVDRDARRLFRMICADDTGLITWNEFSLCLDNAQVFSQLDSLRARILRRWRSLDAAFQGIPGFTDLEQEVDADELTEAICERFGMPEDSARAIF